MQPLSDLPDDLQLYLALVGVLREQGLACASMQVDCRADPGSVPPMLAVTGTPQAKSLLSPALERQLGRTLDPDKEAWRISLDEAWQIIDRLQPL
jgi:hypothetical protein